MLHKIPSQELAQVSSEGVLFAVSVSRVIMSDVRHVLKLTGEVSIASPQRNVLLLNKKARGKAAASSRSNQEDFMAIMGLTDQTVYSFGPEAEWVSVIANDSAEALATAI